MVDTIRKKEKQLRKIFSLYIRLRDAIATTGNIMFCRCVTCWKFVWVNSWDLHAWHCYQWKNLWSKYNEKNVHAQCMDCNYEIESQWRKKIHENYIMNTYWKDTLIEIQNQYNQISKMKFSDINDMIKNYKNKIKNIKDTYLLISNDDGF